jgi:hypothetical protein
MQQRPSYSFWQQLKQPCLKTITWPWQSALDEMMSGV